MPFQDEEDVFYVHTESEAQRLLVLIQEEEENTKRRVLTWIRSIKTNHIKNSKMTEVVTLTRRTLYGHRHTGGLVLMREKYDKNGERVRQPGRQINLPHTDLPQSSDKKKNNDTRLYR